MLSKVFVMATNNASRTHNTPEDVQRLLRVLAGPLSRDCNVTLTPAVQRAYRKLARFNRGNYGVPRCP